MNPLTDQTTRDILAARKERIEASPDYQSAMTYARSRAEQEAAAEAAALASPAAGGAAPAPTPAAAPASGDDWTVLGETWDAAKTGVFTAANETIKSIDEATTWLQNNLMDMRARARDLVGYEGPHNDTAARPDNMGLNINPLKPDAPKTVGGKVAGGVTQFVVALLGPAKFLKAAGAANVAVRGALAGAVVDTTAFDPYEGRMSNLVLEWTKNDPAFGKSVLEFLKADPNDSKATARFKAGLEGGVLGMAAEGVFAGVKALRGTSKSKAKDGDVLKRMQEAADEFRAKNPEDAADDRTVATNAFHPEDGAGKAPRTPNEADESQPFATTEVAPRKAPRTPSEGYEEGTIVVTPEGSTIVGPPRTPLMEAVERLKGVDAELRTKDADGAARAAQDADAAPAQKAPRTPDPDEDFRAPIQNPPGRAPRTPLSEDELVEAVGRSLDDATDKIEAGVGEKAWFDPDAGTFTMSAARPAGAALDFDKLVAEAIGKTGDSLTAEDLKVLSMYRHLQDALVDPDKASKLAADAPVAPAAKNAPEGAPAAPESHAAKRARTERAADVQADVRAAAAKVADLVGKAADRPAKAGKSGLSKAEQAAENASLNPPKVSGSKKASQQGGFVSGSLLAHVAASSLGGLAGFNTAGENATLEEKLTRAGLFALGGVAAVHVGSKLAGSGSKSLKVAADEKSLAAAKEQATVAGLAAKNAEGILPVAAKTAPAYEKAIPRITSAHVDDLVKAMDEGRVSDVSKEMENLGFNFANLDADHEIGSMMNAFFKVLDKHTLKATGGVQTQAETVELGRLLGIEDMGQLGRVLYSDTTNLAARTFAARTFVLASLDKVKSLADAVITNPTDNAAVIAFRKQIVTHGHVQARMKGAQTEIARATAQFRITAQSAKQAERELEQMVDALGGASTNRDLAEMLQKVKHDPAMQNHMARNVGMARSEGTIFSIFINGILSAPATQVANIIGNTLTGLWGVAERGVAAGFSALRPAGPDTVHFGEMKAQLYGMAAGLKDTMFINRAGAGDLFHASRLYAQGKIVQAEEMITASQNLGSTYKAFASNMTPSDVGISKTDLLDARADSISSGSYNMDPSSMMGHIVDWVGGAIRTPGRMLTSADEMFKATFYRGELHAQAYRKATNAGLEGPELHREIARLLDSPTPDMNAAALETARRGTFTLPLEEGIRGKAIQDFVAKTPAKFIIPFVRTPLNILSNVVERTPLAHLASKRAMAEWKAGGSRRDIMMARVAGGTAIYALAGFAAMNGYLVGGGDKRQNAERLGGQLQYSVKIGDQTIQLSKLEPFGTILGIMADAVELYPHIGEQDSMELAGQVILALQRNILDKTYMKGLTDLLQAVEEPERYGKQYLGRFANSFVPFSSGLAAIQRERDPHMKETREYLNSLKSRIPFFADDVPNHINILGEETKFPPGLGPDLLSPVKIATLSQSPVAKEILRLNLDFRDPLPSIQVKEMKIDLDTKQYVALKKYAGAEFKKLAEKVIDSAGYKAIPESPDAEVNGVPTGKQKILSRLYYAAQESGRQKLMNDKAFGPELRKQQQDLLSKQRSILLGNPLTQ